MQEEEDHNKKLGTVFSLSLSLSLSLAVSLWELYSVSLCLSLGEAGREKKSWKSLKTQLWLSVSEHFSFVCLFVFFFFFSFFAPHKQHKIICGKHSRAALEWKAEEIWSLSFLPSASVPKKQQSSSQRQQAQGKLKKSCTNERERERERSPAGWPDETTGSRQANKKGRARIPTHPKKIRRAAGQLFSSFFLGHQIIFIKNGGPLRILFLFLFLFFCGEFSPIVIFLKRKIISQITFFLVVKKAFF
jgi:hypothetical protein